MREYALAVLVLAMTPFFAGLAMMVLRKEEKLLPMMMISIPALALAMIPVVVYAIRRGVIR